MTLLKNILFIFEECKFVTDTLKRLVIQHFLFLHGNALLKVINCRFLMDHLLLTCVSNQL